ncbi:hypothetical protein, partial [Tannerella forsythia]
GLSSNLSKLTKYVLEERYNFFVPPNHGSDHIDTLLFFLDRLGKKLVENGFFYILYTADDRKEYQ